MLIRQNQQPNTLQIRCNFIYMARMAFVKSRVAIFVSGRAKDADRPVVDRESQAGHRRLGVVPLNSPVQQLGHVVCMKDGLV